MTKVWADRNVEYSTFPTDMQGANSYHLMQTVSRFGHYRTECSTYINFRFTISANCTIRIGVAYDSADAGPAKDSQFTGAGWSAVAAGSGHPMDLSVPAGMNTLKMKWYEKAHTAGVVTPPMPHMLDTDEQKLKGCMYVIAVPGAVDITNTTHAKMPWAYSGDAPSGSVDYRSADCLKYFWSATYKERPQYADETAPSSVCQTPADLAEWQTWFANGGTPYASMSLLIAAVNADTSIGTIPRIYFIADGTYNAIGNNAPTRSGTPSAPLYIFAETLNGVVFNGSFGFNVAGRSWIFVDGFRHTGIRTARAYSDNAATEYCVFSRINFSETNGDVAYYNGLGKGFRFCYSTFIDNGVDGVASLPIKNRDNQFGTFDHIHIDGTNCVAGKETTYFEDNDGADRLGISLNCYHNILFANQYLATANGVAQTESELCSQKFGGLVRWNWTVTNSIGHLHPRNSATQTWDEGHCFRDDGVWNAANAGRTGFLGDAPQSVVFDFVCQGINSSDVALSANSALLMMEGDTGSSYNTTFDCVVGDTAASVRSLIADGVLYDCNTAIGGGANKTRAPSNVRIVNLLAKGIDHPIVSDPNGNIGSAVTFTACQGNSAAGFGITLPAGWTNTDPALSQDPNGWWQASGSSPARDDTYIKGVPYYKDRAPASHNLVTTSTAGYNADSPSSTINDTVPPVITVALAAAGGANEVVLTLTATDVSVPITVDWYRMEKLLIDTVYDENTPYNIDDLAGDADYAAALGSITYPPTQDPDYDLGIGASSRQIGKLTIGRWGPDYEFEPSLTGFQILSVTPGTGNRTLFSNVGLVDNDMVAMIPTYIWDGVDGTIALRAALDSINLGAASADSGKTQVFQLGSIPGQYNVNFNATGDWDGTLSGLQAYRKITQVGAQTSGASAAEQTRTDTGLADNTRYYYLAKVTDAAGNITWSTVETVVTDPAASPAVINPSVIPVTASVYDTLQITVTEDTECNTYYTTDGSTPDATDTLVSGGIINLGVGVVAELKLISIEAGAGARNDSDVVTYGPYTVTVSPVSTPTCDDINISVYINSDTNEIDYLVAGNCADPEGAAVALKYINGVQIVDDPQTVATTYGDVTYQNFKMYYTPDTGNETPDPFTYVITNGSVDSLAATITALFRNLYYIATNLTYYITAAQNGRIQAELNIAEDLEVHAINGASITWSVLTPTESGEISVDKYGLVTFSHVASTSRTLTAVIRAVVGAETQDFTVTLNLRWLFIFELSDNVVRIIREFWGIFGRRLGE